MPAHHAKPIVRTSCPANRYTDRDERIIEFSFPGTDAGGLISFRRLADGTPRVEVYRTDGAVQVTTDATVAYVSVDRAVRPVQ